MRSLCGEIKTWGTPQKIAQRYEQLAREAEINKDYALQHLYLQHAEHWNKSAT